MNKALHQVGEYVMLMAKCISVPNRWSMFFKQLIKEIYKLGELTIQSNIRNTERVTHPLRDLFWECTLSCNAKCKHCGSSAEKRKYEGELTTEEIKSAFKQIADSMDASKILINVTGGEPLVRQDLCEVMEYASKELGFHWGMTTNGILLNEKNIEKLKNANMESISVSIDGLQETHDAAAMVVHRVGLADFPRNSRTRRVVPVL